MILKTQTIKLNKKAIDMPDEYISIVEQAVNEAVSTFGDNLLSITLGGSVGKAHIHIGWSDIDLYFVLKEYTIKEIAKYNNIFTNSNIRVQATFYTIKEVEKQMLDAKTKLMIYEKYKYIMNPTIYGYDYYLPVNYETIRQNDVSNLPNVLQSYKEVILDLKNEKMEINQKHIKKMLILLKCLLNYHNIFSFGYEEVLIKYSKLCNDFKFEGERGFQIIKIIDDFENLEKYKEEIILFSEDVFNFIYKYC